MNLLGALGLVCWCLAAVGLIISVLQSFALLLHSRRRRQRALVFPPISILKPLAGLDDSLADNLERFCHLDYPSYELLLGVASIHDAAYPLATKLARRFPERVRVVVQKQERGLNPKVSQLIGLEAEARYSVLTISDSNVRVSRSYLQDIAAHLAPDVGVVTHLLVGTGERSFGAAMDNLHLASSVGPGVLAAHLLAGKSVVVGKSMTLTRADLTLIGGFGAFKDVLAEDYLMGQALIAQGKRIAFGDEHICSVSRHKSVGRFFDRYIRWSIMHRHAVGRLVYVAELLLCPITFALLAICFDGALVDAAFTLVTLQLAFNLLTARALRPTALGIEHLFALVLKDLSLACMLLYGFFANDIHWRGNKRRVLAGTRLQSVEETTLLGAE